MPHKESTPKEIEPNKILINRGDLGGILLIKYIKSILKVGLYFQHPFGIAIHLLYFQASRLIRFVVGIVSQ